MNEDDNKETRHYEVAFLVENEKGRDAVHAVLRRLGAEVTHEGPFENVALAYPIKRRETAYMGYAHFRLERSRAKELEQALKGAAGVVRSLVVTPPFIKQRPKAAPRATVAAGGAPPHAAERKPIESLPLSNEALEKRIEEILQQ